MLGLRCCSRAFSSCQVRGYSVASSGSETVLQGLSCARACEIFPDQGSNLCPLCWQTDSEPLDHQGSPTRQLVNHFGTLSGAFTQREIIHVFATTKLKNREITKKNLLYMIGNYIQYLVINYNGKEAKKYTSKREYIYIGTTSLQLSQYCKSTILSVKRKKIGIHPMSTTRRMNTCNLASSVSYQNSIDKE